VAVSLEVEESAMSGWSGTGHESDLGHAARRTIVGSGPAAQAAEELEQIADLCGQLDLGASGANLAKRLLEPIASLLDAETAALRSFDSSPDMPMPQSIASLGIPDSVGDAYVTRYHRIDPAWRLLQRSLDEPIFADPGRPGVWTRESATPAMMRRYREEFAEYQKGFLLPNDFVHHVGFYFRNQSGQKLLFDLHRGRRASPFDRLEVARARVVARYLHARAMTGWARVEPASPAPPDDSLSAREFEVADAVGCGLSNKEIAAALEISVRTVENHLRSIFAKLAVTSRTRLVARLRGRCT
jgi:DNA-binding CsgD family transcriptional regulator